MSFKMDGWLCNLVNKLNMIRIVSQCLLSHLTDQILPLAPHGAVRKILCNLEHDLLQSRLSIFRFSANETVRSMSGSCPDASSFTLAAVTRSGSLLCFDLNLNEKPGKKKKKPLKARATVQVSIASSFSSTSLPLASARWV